MTLSEAAPALGVAATFADFSGAANVLARRERTMGRDGRARA
jgi:hypothetical protein